VTSDSLLKYYDKLLAPERHALMVAARYRGDDAEAERLQRTAPRVGYRVAHHCSQAEAFQGVALTHLATLLYLSTQFWQALARCIAAAGSTSTTQPDGPEEEVVGILATMFLAHLAGWDRFCTELKIPAEVIQVCLPDWASIEQTREVAQDLACSAEEVTRWVQRLDGEKARVAQQWVSVEGVTEALRGARQYLLAQWP